MSSGDRPLAVVTGASTGIGAATARELAGRGFHVLAGVRRERDGDALRGSGVEPVLLDITRPEQVAALVDRIGGRGLRALVNNAAVSVNAPVEALPLDAWRDLFEVNLFGHVAVTQAVLPALLRDGVGGGPGGRIVNISSVGGRVAMATYGPYAGTKFALEAVSDALRRELAPHGVRVVVVEPGGVRTRMGDRGIATTRRRASDMSDELRGRYGPLVDAVTAHTAAHLERGISSERAASVVAKAVTARNPRTRYAAGLDAAVLTRLARVLPDRLLDRVAAASLRPYFPAVTGARVPS
ncbi:SDR family oxidoreductase [Actinosynnema pretiosum]|uniref:Dehydrogenase n=1 Tax=Actinosynnema pretiosum TaxID=42197 RepID=A0A290ZAY0_9PSEU|nr:SDR family oxidoreductase [Actinosynnema pretiosum]ATE56191.1 dehydrogenase [Actinosynnema pretiosum]